MNEKRRSAKPCVWIAMNEESPEWKALRIPGTTIVQGQARSQVKLNVSGAVWNDSPHPVLLEEVLILAGGERLPHVLGDLGLGISPGEEELPRRVDACDLVKITVTGVATLPATEGSSGDEKWPSVQIVAHWRSNGECLEARTSIRLTLGPE